MIKQYLWNIAAQTDRRLRKKCIHVGNLENAYKPAKQTLPGQTEEDIHTLQQFYMADSFL